MQAREDPEFSRFLLALGNGELQMQETELVSILKSLDLSCREYPATLEDLLQAVYPNISTHSKLIDKFFGDVCIYKSFDLVIDDHCNIYPTEFLNTLCPGGMSPHELILKLNCPISTGFSKGECVMLPRINLRPSESSGYPFQFQRLQFPIKLCFAMTINKSQGQTLLEVGVYIRHVFLMGNFLDEVLGFAFHFVCWVCDLNLGVMLDFAFCCVIWELLLILGFTTFREKQGV
ncbi:uncharacterized protein LOC130804551 [Amaranthus tricolor]|uniref:uncharacterized protein LOC130804551 n=1 Tax=Amaranthus tricolor TaxID=29722 RepID=UPI0025894097|nr:uncharacterized protein LOC130804551 [Amaranthus tricolor]